MNDFFHFPLKGKSALEIVETPPPLPVVGYLVAHHLPELR